MSISYCTFTVGWSLCAVPVERVREVVGNFPCTPVPLAGAAISGLINLRGQIVTASDLRVLLNLATHRDPDDTHAAKNHIIVDIGDEYMSLIVDEIGPVMTAQRSMIESPPSSLDTTIAELVTGVARMPDCLLMILNLDQLLNLQFTGMA